MGGTSSKTDKAEPTLMKRKELAEALQQAHVEHACQRLCAEDYWHDLLDQGAAIIADKPLGTLVDGEVLAQVVDDWLAHVATVEGLQPVIESVAHALLNHARQDPVTFGELLDEAQFEALLEQLLRLRSLRERTIHAVLNHPLISQMVSEMLYTGIKNFLLEENALAKLPGVSSMMKLGRKSVGRAMGGLEEPIRSYLRQNIRATLKTGEQWLNRELSNDRIAELARDAYGRIAPMKPAALLRDVPDDTLPGLVRQGALLSDHAATLDYSRRLVMEGIRAAIEALMAWSLPALLQAMRTDTAARRDTLAPALAHGAEVLKEQGVLSAWAELALGDFYQSEACLSVLGQALRE